MAEELKSLLKNKLLTKAEPAQSSAGFFFFPVILVPCLGRVSKLDPGIGFLILSSQRVTFYVAKAGV